VQEHTLAGLDAKLPQAQLVRTMAHLLGAESAQALQDRAARDAHLQHALNESAERGALLSPETREGVQLRAAHWALQDRDAPAALARLKELPHGAQRRTLSLRLRLKAARLDRRTLEALETARMLAKHRAFSETAAHSIIRGLATDLLSEAHDPSQLQRAWAVLEVEERQMPEVALHAAQRQVALHGDLGLARNWLLPVWEQMVVNPRALGDGLRVKLARVLEAGLDSVDADWLARIEVAQRNNPRDPILQYLAGMACMKRQLWGKAQQLLTQAGLGLQDGGLHRHAWQALARLAEERGDTEQAAAAWKRAAETEIAS
jgi:HemY protein